MRPHKKYIFFPYRNIILSLDKKIDVMIYFYP